MIRVFKIGEISENRFIAFENARVKTGDIAAILTNMSESEDPISAPGWTFDLTMGEGPGARVVRIDLPQLISKSDREEHPIILQRGIVFFRQKLFLCERSAANPLEQEEVILRVKKAVYDEQADIAALKAIVANQEADRI